MNDSRTQAGSTGSCHGGCAGGWQSPAGNPPYSAAHRPYLAAKQSAPVQSLTVDLARLRQFPFHRCGNHA